MKLLNGFMLATLTGSIFLSSIAVAGVRGAPGKVVNLTDIPSMNSWNDGYKYWNVELNNPNSFKASCYVPFLTTTAQDSTPTARHGVSVDIQPNGTNINQVTIKKTFTFVSTGEVKCDEIRADAIIEQKKMVK